jgi:hypothetical protein
MLVYDERSPQPQLWFRQATNTYERTDAPQMLRNAQWYCVGLQTTMKLDNPGSCTWRAEFVALPSSVSAAEMAVGRFSAGSAMTSAYSFWYDQIQPADVVGIGFNRENPYFIGMVLQKSSSRAVVGGKLTNTIVLSGLSLGGVFARQNIMRLITIKYAPAASGIWHILAGTVFGKTPDLTMKTEFGTITKIVKELFSDTLTALDIRMPRGTFSGELKYRDGTQVRRYFDFDSGIDPELDAFKSDKVQALENSQGSIFDLIREFAPVPWFELWFDVDHNTGSQVVLYFREPVWDSTRWAYKKNPNGKLWDDIKPKEIVSIELREDWSNLNTIFFPQFRMVALNNETLATPPVPPLISTRLVKMFGLRAFQPDVTFIHTHGDDGNSVNVYEHARLMRHKLGLWFGIADQYRQGTVKIEGRTDIRIGHKVALYDSVAATSVVNQQHAYVDGVTQSWSLTQPWLTALELSRIINAQVHAHDELEVLAMERENDLVTLDWKA